MPTTASAAVPESGSDSLTALAAHYLPRLERAQDSMMLQTAIPPDVGALVDELADRLDAVATPWAYDAIDPYLGQSLLSALLAGEKALRAPDEDDRRRRVRIALERVRQTLRDVTDEAPASEGAETKGVVKWLTDTLSVPQADIATLLGVSTRTLQRWLSSDAPPPEGAEEARIRMVARTIAHLRHVFTGPGAVRWFMRPHSALDGRRPIDLLGDPLNAPKLVRLASRSRSTVAT